MKTLSPLLLAACTMLMASCTAPVVKRIEHNPEIYNALSERQKVMVQNGKIEEGMTKQAVFLAWGRPDRAAKGSTQGKPYERWSYTRYDSVPSTSVGFGYGMGYGGYYGGHGRHGGFGYYEPVMFYEPVINYLPYEARRVEFLNNRVSGWSVAR